MLLRLNGTRRMLSLKLIILLLFLTGIIMVVTNAYWFIKGISVVEPIPFESEASIEPEIQVNTTSNTQIEQEFKPVYGDQYGHLLIPKLDAKIPIFYGSEEDQLKQGIGHVKRTALPGENNNTVLSGHRDTVFRHLGKIETGDHFIIETEAGTYTYRVKKIRIVDKDNRTVIVSKPKATLTVITCYPFGFAGNAPQRFIVIADLILSEKS